MIGTGRTAARVAVAGVTLAATFTGGAALAETGQATGQFPRNFLLYESQARKPVDDPTEEKWTISNKLSKNLGFFPCNLSKNTGSGRASARTVEFTAPLFYRGEQLVVYRSAGAARDAMAGLLAQAGSCKRVKSGPAVFTASAKPVSAGDQAVRVAIQGYDPKSGRPTIDGQRAVVVRKGRALAFYLLSGDYGKVRDSDFAEPLRDARKMAARVCSLPGVC
ncbi:hypothetical protein GCM10010517_76540 [Streptosporangium fragile]|uniref:PknH-like extracellular domain-containing protein n=1 Tax=Streptosporangium fragile TaxID=46186 RepID=A0ABN3WEC5_9ACTN